MTSPTRNPPGKPIDSPDFQELIFHGLHADQPYALLQVKTYKARPRDNSIQICMDLKGQELTFPIGHVIGKINPKTRDVIQSEEMIAMLGKDMRTATDDTITLVGDTKVTSIFDRMK